MNDDEVVVVRHFGTLVDYDLVQIFCGDLCSLPDVIDKWEGGM